MSRTAVDFDIFSQTCPFFYSCEEENANNWYNCSHPEAYREEDDSPGCCYSWHCPLGTEAEPDDLTGGPDAVADYDTIDWDGLNEDLPRIEDGEILLIDASEDAPEETKQAYHAYNSYMNRYNHTA